MFASRKKLIFASAALAMAVSAPAVRAEEPHVAPMTAFAKETVMKWVADPMVVNAVKAQNAKYAALAQADVDKLDKDWRAQVDAADKPLINAVLGNDLSKFLSAKKDETAGMVTEVFIMDNKGLNAGQSDVTSDYWQGDEAKWKKTYLVGPDAVFVDKVEKDESTQQMQSQVSVSIKDPGTNEVIGAVTVGVNLDKL